MKKTLLGLMLSVALLGGTAVTANAADTTPATSNGTVNFKGGSMTIDDGNTSTAAANLTFGEHDITAADGTVQQFTNTNGTAKVSVQDLRGTAAGWSLGVAQGEQFATGTAASDSKLTSAVLTLKSTFDDKNSSNDSSGSNATVNDVILKPNGASTTIMTAAKGSGNGTSIDKIDGSTLDVPTNTAKTADKTYTTTLTWNLSDTPTNN